MRLIVPLPAELAVHVDRVQLFDIETKLAAAALPMALLSTQDHPASMPETY